MNNRLEKIKIALHKVWPAAELELIDNSHLHVGHLGATSGKGHFKLVIHEKKLAQETRLNQHRAIYRALDSLMETDIHALEIEVKHH